MCKAFDHGNRFSADQLSRAVITLTDHSTTGWTEAKFSDVTHLSWVIF